MEEKGRLGMNFLVLYTFMMIFVIFLSFFRNVI